MIGINRHLRRLLTAHQLVESLLVDALGKRGGAVVEDPRHPARPDGSLCGSKAHSRQTCPHFKAS